MRIERVRDDGTTTRHPTQNVTGRRCQEFYRLRPSSRRGYVSPRGWPAGVRCSPFGTSTWEMWNGQINCCVQINALLKAFSACLETFVPITRIPSPSGLQHPCTFDSYRPLPNPGRGQIGIDINGGIPE